MTDQAPPTILLVEDNEIKRYTVAKVLQKAGFVVREAITGREALRMVHEQPALVVLDIKLPDISGFEVCRVIKSDPATRAIPVLHVSSTFVELEDKIYGLEGGADGYLTDVMEPLELIATVNALLRTRKAEEAAELSSQQWQTTFDAVSDGVVLLERDGRVAQVNQAFERIVGRPWAELSGRTFHEVLGLAAEPGESPFLRMLGSRHRESADLTLGDRWLEIAVDPIRGQDGAVKGALGILSDITERKRAEEERRRLLEREQQARLEAEEANRAKDQFLAVLSHELRTPLNPVLLAVTAMLERPLPPDELRPILETIRENVELQSRLIDDLLDVMRIVRGKMPLHWEVADGHELIRRAVEISRSDLRGLDLRLEVDLEAAHHHVSADSARLQQVFWNLIKNAIKFTAAGGTIAIRSRNEADPADRSEQLVVEVSDTGIGIEPDVIARIFDPFQQGETAVTRKFGGLGLGLAISRAIVDAHHGSLAASSAGKGQGATFAVRLRTVPEPADEPERPAPIRRAPANGMRDVPLRILLVEDEPATRRLMERLLRGLGFVVTAASTVEEALEVVRAEEFDLLISDIGLPDRSGLDLMRQVAASQAIPAIALTGYGMEEDVRRSRDAGFVAHLTKPIDFNKLEAMIRQVMQLAG